MKSGYHWATGPGLAIALLLQSGPSFADTKVWLIGGGNTLSNSQGQIEENVRWLQSDLRARGIDVRTYFTHGNGSEHDVIYYAPDQERDPLDDVLNRVYGKELTFLQRTKHNTLPEIAGSTEKSALLKSLAQDFAEVQADDHVLVVYNGHGDIEPQDTRRNSLKLWRDSRLDIAELDQALDQLPDSVQVSFVLTQCFSGSFTQLVYDNPFSDKLASQSRCGFMAESDRRQAEGCDLGINQAEFRDYTTYFFAALFGESRLGEPLARELIDLDNSGQVSFSEAHLYTLAAANSGDLSRSSSEVLLEQEQPWYTRWDSWRRPPDNQYARIAQAVAERESLTSRGLPLVRDLFDKLAQKKAIEVLHSDLRNRLKLIQQRLIASVQTDPEQVAELAPAERLQLAQQLSSQPDFDELVTLQAELQTLNGRLLQSHRALAQTEKVLRMNRLARLSHWVNTEAVNQIRACEADRHL